MLAAARDEYAAESLRGRGGSDMVARYAGRMDGLVRQIADAAHLRCASAPWAICAIGGYGRRALCLHSDIDLLIVFDGRLSRSEEQFVNALLQPLWDLRLTIGHQIRELRELDDVDEGNPEFLLALVDARPVAGDERVFEAARARFPRTNDRHARGLLNSLLSLTRERHAAFNDTFYQLEPDIKEAPSGLRDIAAVRWIQELAGPDWNGSATVDGAQLEESEDFLLRIRSILHVECGRNKNVLSHTLQERVAEVLGFEGGSPQQRVESLMREYFRRARTVARALETARGLGRPAPRGFDAGAWIASYEMAGAGEQQWKLIRDLLRPRPGLYADLSEMHDSGLLTRIFPEFERIHCRVIRDFYHKYTVDEHTLLTLRNLESLLDTPNPSRQRFGGILRELHAPDLLSLALLFHDVGKWKDDDHAVESVRLAKTMLGRLKLPPEARDTVEFLIRNHLQMSRVAFRRDSEDPDVVRRFAALVGTEEHLKMLCLMTLVDVDAVGPGTLTPWKEELLWRLYVDTYNHLTLAYGDELIEKDQSGLAALQSGRPSDIGEAELSRFLEGLPRRYLALFDASVIYRHVRLARDIHPDEVHPFLEQKDANWELTVVATDKPYLFSNISGVLSYFGMDILRGQAMTTPDGLVLDVFEFTDREGFLRQNPSAASQICRLLDEVVAGTKDVTKLLRGRARNVLHRRSPRAAPMVHFDDEHSQKYTVIEIIADDAVGLLYRISRAISSHQCDVDLVLIATEGDVAIDVFHVTSRGAKLSKAEQASVKQSLEHELEQRHETH
jgi:[protein-PII] uridylyltransferase